ncbi:MAG: lytic transglycosylase domain-containing protein [Ruminococcaceae bacterium]|nr:lytic transglycosylase domain-containing protein [Oscillospiraceae bacterium]
MNSIRRNKTSYAPLIIILIVIAIVFGLLFDLVCTLIERSSYPKPEEYSEFVTKYAHEYGVDEALVYAVMKTESGFDSSAVSSKGAVGLMQIMPSTFEWLTNDIFHEHLDKGMLYDPETNIKYGTYYLSRLYDRFGDWDTAIAAYNGGEGNVSEWLSDPKYSDDGKKLNVNKIPSEFRETENYVKKVNKALKKYKELYDK